MRTTFVREIVRQKSFQIESLPWILKVYRRPFDRWSSQGRQALFGAPNFILFLLFQRFWPFRTQGFLKYRFRGQEKRMHFSAKNSQFRALYLSSFAEGYEPQTTALINSIMPAKGVFYDIGSNWGWFSLSLAALPTFQGKIHAFEPFGPSFADLSSMVDQAGLGTTIQCHQTALADTCGNAAMVVPDFISSGLATLKEDGNAKGTATKVATLDSLALEPPSVMKVDVEGAEAKVFHGGAGLIAQHKPMIIFENYRPFNELDGVLEPMVYLASLGYVFYRLAWVRKTKNISFYMGDDGDPTPQSTETLALAEFEPAERLLLADGLNIFACHRDRVGELAQQFQKI